MTLVWGLMIALTGIVSLTACSGPRYDTVRGEGSYSDERPATVKEADRVDGRAGAFKSAPPAGSPSH